jgi:hypothetical protein
MNNNYELLAFCIEKLTAEGIDYVLTSDPANKKPPVLRVPRLETRSELLCQTIIFGFISCKLDGNKRKGVRMNHPVTGAMYDIYCYSPDSLEESPDAIDLMVWTANAGAKFDWKDLSHGDAGWSDGWELEGCEHLDQRLAFLAYLMSYEVIDLPEATPLTLEELRTVAAASQAEGGKGVYCYGPDPDHNWLHLDEKGELVLSMTSSSKVLHITENHIDDKGRLVIDGKIVLTSSTPL